MKKILFTTLLLALTSQFINADEVKQKTNEELIAEFMKLDQEIEKEKAKTLALKKESEDIRKLGQTVDKLAKKLGVSD